jgi:hypothetical protein
MMFVGGITAASGWSQWRSEHLGRSLSDSVGLIGSERGTVCGTMDAPKGVDRPVVTAIRGEDSIRGSALGNWHCR